MLCGVMREAERRERRLRAAWALLTSLPGGSECLPSHHALLGCSRQQTMKTASSDEELAFKQKERDINQRLDMHIYSVYKCIILKSLTVRV